MKYIVPISSASRSRPRTPPVAHLPVSTWHGTPLWLTLLLSMSLPNSVTCCCNSKCCDSDAYRFGVGFVHILQFYDYLLDSAVSTMF
mmetsp:Transcript_102528/g.201105  ORF Transcript_102528/g.201105 Transcript_102528/m.201105 type:complete len:87 (+) Transcript_102528:645-905(+)